MIAGHIKLLKIGGIKIYENENIILKYDLNNQWIYAEWLSMQTVESLINSCEKLLEFVKMYSCSKVISETKSLTGTWIEAGEWMEQNWFPRMARYGCRHIAWVALINSTDPEIQFLIQQLTTWDLEGITWLIFEDVETAEGWLREI